MLIQARQIEAIETTLTKEQWLALIGAAATFGTAIVNAVS